ncbi:unnamed protein product [Zymoseptoria tritici ST99CH_1A5]|uniref:Protein kinase domain-containing protein n=1 Tax=Zymoseptoria tritici ST99CH_1A5 TaxID=1276529 RepID=A0A1Y6LH61_ZYMTR|nr:unnamed protein product [Zymoseptoria tritici ST99CH_1A5]
MSSISRPHGDAPHDIAVGEGQAQDNDDGQISSRISTDDAPSAGVDDRTHARVVDLMPPGVADEGSAALAAEPQVRNHKAFAQNNAAVVLPPLDTSVVLLPPRSTQPIPPGSARLSLKTDLDSPTKAGAARASDTPTINYDASPPVESASLQSITSITSPVHLPPTTSSLRSNMSTTSLNSSLSYGSNLPSPYLAAMTDLTPLPSPAVNLSTDSFWRKRRITASGRSRDNSLGEQTPRQPTSQPTSPESPSTRRKKGYGSLMQEAAIANAAGLAGAQDNNKGSTQAHGRTRSISDFVPDQLHNVRPRHVTYGASGGAVQDTAEYHMQREAYLAAQRGLTSTAPPALAGAEREHLPTPPPSSSSATGSDEAEEEPPHLEDGTASEILEVHCGIHDKRRKFRPLRQLGQGTFSTVMLATRERIPAHPTPEIEDHLDPHQLVAIKIVEHGPAGGADEERIEISLKREVEMLKSISHPSLVHLKACEYQPSRALLVLSYCQGGDLFDFASQKRDLLTPHLVQRMFAELVSAVRYLHTQGIVHRDIKLENVLVNLPESALQSLPDPRTHPTPIVILTDLGLSRRIPEPPESPLLTTRCGSEDYAAPEILLGQPYDGRLTDGWALGVLLYALMEGRLPFDAPPGKIDRSRNTHRIARCDWIWCRFGDDDGDWDAGRGKEWEGARPCVEGLLKKVRMGRKGLDVIEGLEWVKSGIAVEGGLQVREEDWMEID